MDVIQIAGMQFNRKANLSKTKFCKMYASHADKIRISSEELYYKVYGKSKNKSNDE